MLEVVSGGAAVAPLLGKEPARWEQPYLTCDGQVPVTEPHTTTNLKGSCSSSPAPPPTLPFFSVAFDQPLRSPWRWRCWAEPGIENWRLNGSSGRRGGHGRRVERRSRWVRVKRCDPAIAGSEGSTQKWILKELWWPKPHDRFPKHQEIIFLRLSFHSITFLESCEG